MKASKRHIKAALLTFPAAAAFFLTGCAKLTHLDQLLTLKHYSDNKEAQARYVRNQDEKFERLLDVARRGDFSETETQSGILKAFGDPVFSRPAERDGRKCEEWLYRYAMEMFDSPKVYLYFNPEGRLIDWELYAPKTPQTPESEKGQS